jgi:hypothetical protein
VHADKLLRNEPGRRKRAGFVDGNGAIIFLRRESVMKKWILLIAAIMLSMGGFVRAEENKLGVDLDVTWVSKYLWHGFDRLDDRAAFQPSINFNLYDTGFSFKLWMSYACSGGSSSSLPGGGRVNATEYRYIVAYDHTLFKSESYATDVTANYIYYDFIDEPDKAQDAQEIGVGFSWPNICPAGFVPSYYVGKIWPSKSNSVLTGEYGGWIHVFGLGYDLKVPGFLPDKPEQVINLSASLTYNDGYGGANVDHDWSHATFGVSTNIAVGKLTFTPAVYYQASFDDSVNTEDELYTGISMSCSF